MEVAVFVKFIFKRTDGLMSFSFYQTASGLPDQSILMWNKCKAFSANLAHLLLFMAI